MVMAEDCIKEILMFLSRESNFTGNKLVNQLQKTLCVLLYRQVFQGVNFHLQKSLTLGIV